jgi:hypothetical protein
MLDFSVDYLKRRAQFQGPLRETFLQYEQKMLLLVCSISKEEIGRKKLSTEKGLLSLIYLSQSSNITVREKSLGVLFSVTQQFHEYANILTSSENTKILLENLRIKNDYLNFCVLGIITSIVRSERYAKLYANGEMALKMYNFLANILVRDDFLYNVVNLFSVTDEERKEANERARASGLLKQIDKLSKSDKDLFNILKQAGFEKREEKEKFLSSLNHKRYNERQEEQRMHEELKHLRSVLDRAEVENDSVLKDQTKVSINSLKSEIDIYKQNQRDKKRKQSVELGLGNKSIDDKDYEDTVEQLKVQKWVTMYGLGTAEKNILIKKRREGTKKLLLASSVALWSTLEVVQAQDDIQEEILKDMIGEKSMNISMHLLAEKNTDIVQTSGLATLACITTIGGRRLRGCFPIEVIDSVIKFLNPDCTLPIQSKQRELSILILSTISQHDDLICSNLLNRNILNVLFKIISTCREEYRGREKLAVSQFIMTLSNQTGKENKILELDDIKGIIDLLSCNETHIFVHVALSLWGIGRNEINALTVIENGGIESLLAIVENYLDIANPSNITYNPQIQYLEAAMIATFLYSQYESARLAMERKSTFETILKVVQCPHLPASVRQNAINTLLAFSISPTCLQMLIEQNMCEVFYNVVKSHDATIQQKKVACIFFDMASSTPLYVDIQKRLGNNDNSLVEKIYVTMIHFEEVELQEIGALGLARRALIKGKKKIIADLDGVVDLIALLESSKSIKVLEATSHALMNLSVLSHNQRIIALEGLDVLTSSCIEPPSPAIHMFCVRTIANLTKHKDNRTLIYRAELRLKALNVALIANKGNNDNKHHLQINDMTDQKIEEGEKQIEFSDLKNTYGNFFDQLNNQIYNFEKLGDVNTNVKEIEKLQLKNKFQKKEEERQQIDALLELEKPRQGALKLLQNKTRRRVRRRNSRSSSRSSRLKKNKTTTHSNRPNTAPIRRRKPKPLKFAPAASNKLTQELRTSINTLWMKGAVSKSYQPTIPPSPRPKTANPSPRFKFQHGFREREQNSSRNQEETYAPAYDDEDEAKSTQFVSFLQPVDLLQEDPVMPNNRFTNWTPRIQAFETFENQMEDNENINTKLKATMTPRHDAFKVELRPNSARSNFSFYKKHAVGERIKFINEDLGQIFTWKHVPGSSIAEETSLPFYILPSGEKAYFYQSPRYLHEAAVIRPELPQPPLSVTNDIMTSVLPSNVHIEPPLTQFLFPPHRVSFNNLDKWVDEEAWESSLKLTDIVDDDPLVLKVEDGVKLNPKKTFSVQMVVKAFDRLRNGGMDFFHSKIFEPRNVLTDSKSLIDTAAVFKKSFALDWDRMIRKPLLKKIVAESTMEEVLIKLALRDNYHVLLQAFDYYHSEGGGESFSIQKNGYKKFLKDCDIINEHSKYCKSIHLDLVFQKVNLEVEVNSDDEAGEIQELENKRNDDRALMRCEFVEMMIHLATRKYLLSGRTNSPAIALDIFCKKHIQQRIPKIAKLESNDFRIMRLYNKDVDNVLFKYQPALQDVLGFYSHTKLIVYEDGSTSLASPNIAITDQHEHVSPTKPKSSSKGSKSHGTSSSRSKKGGKASSPRRNKAKKRKKQIAKSDLLSKKDWIKLMHHSGLVGSKDFVGISEYAATCIFLFSKSNVADELLDKTRYRNANECDFYEAICRVANVVNLPSKRHIEKFGGTSIEQFFHTADLSDEELVKRRSYIKESLDTIQVYKEMDLFREFSSEHMAKAATSLADKLEVFLPLFLNQLKVGGRKSFF